MNARDWPNDWKNNYIFICFRPQCFKFKNFYILSGLGLVQHYDHKNSAKETNCFMCVTSAAVLVTSLVQLTASQSTVPYDYSHSTAGFTVSIFLFWPWTWPISVVMLYYDLTFVNGCCVNYLSQNTTGTGNTTYVSLFTNRLIIIKYYV